MKRVAIIIITLCVFLVKTEAQIYMADSCRVSFFSAATIENITAVNTQSKPVMSTSTGDIQISINIQEFIFKSKLMQEHFNEDYMESDKYPHAVFKGKVNEKVDYTKDGVNTVTVTGPMNIHGVEKIITIPGTITIQNGIIFIASKFDVAPSDYNIKVPSVIGSDVAKQIAVAFTATLKPYKVK